MELTLSSTNWIVVLACVVAAQVVSTLWFVVFFGEPWAREYGASSKQEHTKAIPGYSYAVQALCTLAMVLSLTVLHRSVGVASLGDSLRLGALVALGFCVATGLPGQAFLKRWRVAVLALGCQVAMIVTVSLILGLWR